MVVLEVLEIDYRMSANAIWQVNLIAGRVDPSDDFEWPNIFRFQLTGFRVGLGHRVLH